MKSTIVMITMLTLSPAVHAACTNTAMIDNAPDNRYSYSSDGAEVTDNVTGLIWQRCSVGQTWNAANENCDGSASEFTTWAEALAYPPTDSAWRLPNIKELTSLVCFCRSSPAINTTAFPNTENTYYWSSQPDSESIYSSWLLSFVSGAQALDNRSSGFSDYPIRLVRNGD